MKFKDIPARVYFFNSWAGGEEKRTADIDISIEGKDCLISAAVIRLPFALEESYIPYKADIVNLNEATKRFTVKC